MYFLRNLTIVGIISVMLLASDLLYVFNKNFIVLGNFRYLWAPIFIVFVVLYHNKALTLNSVKYACKGSVINLFASCSIYGQLPPHSLNKG
jgi:hypothetical protein